MCAGNRGTQGAGVPSVGTWGEDHGMQETTQEMELGGVRALRTLETHGGGAHTLGWPSHSTAVENPGPKRAHPTHTLLPALPLNATGLSPGSLRTEEQQQEGVGSHCEVGQFPFPKRGKQASLPDHTHSGRPGLESRSPTIALHSRSPPGCAGHTIVPSMTPGSRGKRGEAGDTCNSAGGFQERGWGRGSSALLFKLPPHLSREQHKQVETPEP